MTVCLATTGHCCWIDGKTCRYLRDDGVIPDRRWVCTLREELGSWEEVHTDQRYIEHILPTMQRLGTTLCGDWPPVGHKCAECGVIGE